MEGVPPAVELGENTDGDGEAVWVLTAVVKKFSMGGCDKVVGGSVFSLPCSPAQLLSQRDQRYSALSHRQADEQTRSQTQTHTHTAC